MSNTSSTHTVNVKTDIPKATAEAEKLNATLNKAAATAGRVATPVASARAANKRDMGGELGRESGMARSIGAGTGAAGRDFAKQSEGLGGLVRLYATFAANIFAATAAFGALSRAADTSNMVKGLDQLGAASGRALGTLSKDIMRVTDGAVSLREAMESVAKASSAGLSNSQIKDIGLYANKAAQTLGVSVPDALSRLTRGIAKLEPELLDEIGIFIRIDKAVADYARSVGKSVTSLTDFERRQAFANATLDQAKEKFGAIDIDVNPYSKLAASLQNITFNVLELVNKGLGPIAKLLAENSLLLGGAIAYMGTKLLRTAIPAINQWRGSIVKAAEEAEEKARDINTSFGISKAMDWEKRLNIPELKSAVATAKKELESVSKVKPASMLTGKTPVSVSRLEAAGAAATSKEMADVARRTKNVETLLAKELAANNQIRTAKAIRYEEEIAYNNKLLAQTRAAALAQTNLTLADKVFQKEAIDAGPTRSEWAREKIKKDAANRATTLRALSSVADDTMRMGISGSMEKLNKELNEKGIKGIQLFTTRAKGLLSAVTTSVGIFASAVSGYLMIFTLAAAAIGGALSFFSATKKEAAASGEAFDSLNGSVKTVADTLERIQMMEDPLRAISVETIQAKATALKELGDSAVLAAKRAFDELSKMNPGDKFVNFIKSMWGGDTQAKFAESLSDTITMAFKAADDSEANIAAKKYIEGILGVSVTDTKGLEKALDKIAQSGDKVTAANISKEIEKIGMRAAVSAAKGTELVEGLKATTKEAQNFNNSLLSKDPLSKIAEMGIGDMARLAAAIEDPTQRLATMTRVAGSAEALKLFPEESIKNLVKTSAELDNITISLDKANDSIKNYEQAEAELRKERDSQALVGALPEEIRKTEEAIKSMARGKKYQIDLKASLEVRTEAASKVFADAIAKKIQDSAQVMAAGIAVELNKAQSVVASTIGGLLGDTKSGIAMRAELEKSSIIASMEVAKQSLNLALVMEKANMLQEQANLEAKKSKPNGGFTDKDQARLDKLSSNLAFIDLIKNQKSGKAPVTAGYLASQGAVDPEIFSLVAKVESLGIQLAAGRAQLAAVDIKTSVAVMGVELKDLQDSLKVRGERVALATKELELVRAYGGEKSDAYLQAKAENDLEAAGFKDAAARATELKNLEEKAFLLSKTTGDLNREKIVTDIRGLADKYAANEQLRSSAMEILKAEQEQNRVLNASNKAFEEAEKLNADRVSQLAQVKKVEEESIKLDEQKLELYSKMEHASALVVANEREAIELKKLQKEKLDEIITAANNYQNKIKDLSRRDLQVSEGLTKVPEGSDSGKVMLAVQKEIRGEIDRENVAYNQVLKSIEQIYGIKLDILKVTSDEAKYQAALNDLIKVQQERMEDLKSMSESLVGVFGDIGGALGNVAEVVGTIADRQEKYTLAIAEQQKAITTVRDIESQGLAASSEQYDAKSKAEKEIAELSRKNTKQELNDNIKLVSSTKKMFSEKTAAYKALDAVEKGMHVYKMAMFAKEVAMSMWAAGQELMAALIPLPAKAVGATVNQAEKGDPYTAFARMAAMAAAMAALLSSVGAKSPTVTAGSSAADRQEVQGTGQSWSDGKKVDNGGGVFGDTEAKSESIRKSLDLVAENSIEGITYYSKMVELLESIDRGINNTAKDLYGIGGLRTGSMFGTAEGTNSGSGLLGSGLFASKSSSSIGDSGLIIKGTFEQLAGIAEGAALSFYEDVTTTTKKWYGKTKTTTNRNLEAVDSAVSDGIEEIFSNSLKLFEELGKNLGYSLDSIVGSLSNINVDQMVSLRGLKGDEFEKEFSAIVSTILDQGAMAVFGTIVDKYREFGEAPLETVIRVIDGATKVNEALFSIGVSSIQLGQMLSESDLAISNALISAAGGLDEFISKTDFFRDNFLTESQRLAPITKAVDTELSRLAGLATDSSLAMEIASVRSREAFANIVLGIDRSTVEGQALYTGLMNVSSGFAELYPALEDTGSSLKDLLAEHAKLIDTYNQLTMTEAQYNAEKSKNYSAEEKAQFNTNLALQREIDLIKERNSLNDKYTAMEVDMLRAQGKEIEATALARSRELEALMPENRALQQLIYTRNDEIEAIKEQQSILSSIESTRTNAATKYMSEEEKIIYLRDKERAKISATNLALFDMTTALMVAEAAMNTAAANLLAGFEKVKQKADDAKAKVLEVAQEGLATLEEKADTLKSSLADLARQGLDVLSSKLATLKANLQSLTTQGFSTLNQKTITAGTNVDDIKDRMRDAYKSALQVQQDATAAYASAVSEQAQATSNAAIEARNALRALNRSLKEFIQSIQTNDLSVNSENTKLAVLKSEFSKVLKEAQAGDKLAIEALPDASSKLLEAAKAQATSKAEYLATFGMVNGALASIADSIDTKVGTEDEATNSMAALSSSTNAAAAALATANAQLAEWSEVLKKSGIDIENEILEEEKSKTPTGLSEELTKGIENLTIAEQDLKTWLDLIGEEAASLAQITEPESLTELITAFSGLTTDISAVEGNIAQYIAETNAQLTAAGFGQDALLTNTLELTIDQIITEKDKVIATLDSLGTEIGKYIENVNIVLTDLGFSPEELLARTISLAPESLELAFQSAVDVYKNALLEVSDWAAELTLLGISFTPYSNGDSSLRYLSDEFSEAKEAFDDANTRIEGYLTGVANIIGSLAPVITASTAAASSAIAAVNAAAAKAAEVAARPITSPVVTPSSGATAPTPVAAAAAPSVDFLNKIVSYPTGWADVSDSVRVPTYGSGTLADALAFFGITGLAKGGLFEGGLRVVGEDGPELEATGPSRVWTADQTRSFLGNRGNPQAANDQLVSEVRELRKQVNTLTNLNAAIADNTLKTNRTLTRVTQGGEAMLTEAA